MTDRSLGDLLAIDPSISSAGVALFRGGKLAGAGNVRVPASKLCMGNRCLTMAESIVRWAMRFNAEPRTLVLEWPQIYRGSKMEGDPNDLPPMAGVGMAVAGILAMGVAARNIQMEVVSYLPREWTGGTDKSRKKAEAFTSVRGKRILTRLSPEEIEEIPESHDAMDAVGLGLYSLGRLDPVRLFPGASDDTVH